MDKIMETMQWHWLCIGEIRGDGRRALAQVGYILGVVVLGVGVAGIAAMAGVIVMACLILVSIFALPFERYHYPYGYRRYRRW